MVLVELISLLGSFASLIGVIYLFTPNGQAFTPTQNYLLISFVILFVITIIIRVKTYFKCKPKYYKNDKQILKYMFNWISKGGRVAIFTRDMTWANDEAMKQLLIQKAQKNELLLFMPNRIALSNELEASGAEIFTYQELNYDPESRFTIIHKGRMDSEVAVGRKVDGKHMIEEFQKGQHPIFSIADDLIDILIQYNKLK